ncbi:MAG: ATP-binding protein [Balneolaceae bacterium]
MNQPQEKKTLHNTINYALIGLFFGFIFPIAATLFDISLQNLPLTFPNVLKVQSMNPLHWIIDTAPVFLGLFSALAGYLKDQVVNVNRELEEIIAKRTESIERKNQLLKQEIDHRKEAELELVKAKEQAEAGANAKTRFLSTMSHEIRTPLNAIIGMTGLLNDGSLSSEQREFVKIIDKSGENLLGIINNILEYAKIDSGVAVLEEVEFSITGLLDDVIEIISTNNLKEQVELSYKVDETIPSVLIGDSARIRQVLVHLVRNAIKFTEEGLITILVEPGQMDESSLELDIKVKDTGIGIPKENQEGLFKYFSQVDSSNTRKYGGTGLGLAICKKLVEMLGGEISLESEVGVGSTFHFNIVVKKTMNSTGENDIIAKDRIVESTKRLSPSEGRTDININMPVKKLKILLAEDNDINQKVIGKMLARLGQSCDVAGNGIEALEMCQLIPYDLIFMDMKMPEMDGVEATVELLSLEPKLKKTPVIVAMTANAMDEDRKKCLDAGMNDFLAKPVKLEELEAMMQKWFKAES